MIDMYYYEDMDKEIYTGKLAEYELLGEVLKKPEETLEYIPYRDAIEAIKKKQPWKDPTNPEKKFPNDLHKKIAAKLCPTNYKRLRFYTAVGSELDRFHGVDAFFELDFVESEKIKTIRVTFDLTINPKKEEYKADELVFVPEEAIDFEENLKEYEEVVSEAAKKISKIFEKKLKKEG